MKKRRWTARIRKFFVLIEAAARNQENYKRRDWAAMIAKNGASMAIAPAVAGQWQSTQR
jgi:hypothetical protein